MGAANEGQTNGRDTHPEIGYSGLDSSRARPMYDKQKIEEMVSTVRNALVDERVSQITDHFAGYFDELGITVAMKDSTLDEEIRELKNKLLPVVAELQMPFLWMVTFQRAGKSAATLFPDGLFTGAKASPRVAIVLEPESEQLDQMATTMPVWAVGVTQQPFCCSALLGEISQRGSYGHRIDPLQGRRSQCSL